MLVGLQKIPCLIAALLLLLITACGRSGGIVDNGSRPKTPPPAESGAEDAPMDASYSPDEPEAVKQSAPAPATDSASQTSSVNESVPTSGANADHTPPNDILDGEYTLAWISAATYERAESSTTVLLGGHAAGISYVDELCPVAAARTTAYGLAVHMCDAINVQVRAPGRRILNLAHNMTESEINRVVDSIATE